MTIIPVIFSASPDAETAYNNAKDGLKLEAQDLLDKFVASANAINSDIIELVGIIQRVLSANLVVTMGSVDLTKIESTSGLGLLQSTPIIAELSSLKGKMEQHKDRMLINSKALKTAFDSAIAINAKLVGINLGPIDHLLDASQKNANDIRDYMKKLKEIKDWDAPNGEKIVKEINDIAKECIDSLLLINGICKEITTLREDFTYTPIK